MAPTVATDRLAHRARALDARWIAGQRWFRAKSRPIAGVTLRDAAELGDGPGWLLVLGVSYQDGGQDRYLVPAIADDEGFREPRDGEGIWRSLVEGIAIGGVLRGRTGSFGFEATPALDELLPGGPAAAGGLEERRLVAEQSNTAAVLADRLFLKLYRRLEPGTNPEVEVSAFLTAVGFAHAPLLGGAMTYLANEESCAAAILQQLVPSRGDAWGWALARLVAGPEGAAEVVAGAAQVGGITAELHEALASRPDAPGFPARLATPEELAAWRASAEGQVQAAIEALRGDARLRLEALAPAILDRLAAIQAAGTARSSRIHGDYHLGQLLRTADGFAIVDFEGEPARPLAERRQPSSPLRDVAGMLRSFDYAARTAQRAAASGFEPDAWLPDARAAFLAAYGGVSPGGEALLTAFELEKACYEVRYEADNRPEWVWLPLAALERLVG
jgi:trehalose synthase-fused probable maltokinase